MKQYLPILKEIALFENINEADILTILHCLGSKTSIFPKDQIVFKREEKLDCFGIVLEGQVQIYQEDFFGNNNILSNINAGNLFGESFAFSKNQKLPINVIATTNSTLLFINCQRFTTPCTNACTFHNRLIQNMLSIVSMKNILLTQKIEFASKRTTRDKLLAFLSAQAQTAGSSSFHIPYNRQELADYLSVDRSAMSAELSKLRKDGILEFNKNFFELLSFSDS